MRKTILLIIIVASLSNCIRESYDTYKYTIKNETGKSIIIKSYSARYPDVSPIIINLPVGGELTKTETTRHSYNFLDFFGESNADSSVLRDSLKIIYQNSKVSFFTFNLCKDVRNPLNFCEYGGLEEVYIFTEQDYENAEPCNGNCE